MVLQRNEINEKDTWDLSTIYPTDQAWEEALKDLTEQLEKVAQYEGHLLDSADSLLEITEFSLEMERQMEKLYVYAHMKNDQDTREAKYQEYYAKAMTLYSQLDQAFSFYEPEFMEISEKQYVDFLEAQPKLRFINTILTSFCKARNTFFHNVKKNYWLELGKSLVRQVKPSLSWTMRILCSLMSSTMMVRKFSYLMGLTHA